MRRKTEKQSKKITHITTYLLSLCGYSPVAGCFVCDSHQKIVMEDKGDNKSRAWSLPSIATGRREDGDDTGRWSRTDNRQFSSRYLLRGRRYLCCGISCRIQCRSVRHNRSHIRLRLQCQSSTKPFWRIEGVVVNLKEISTLQQSYGGKVVSRHFTTDISVEK